MLGKTPFHKVMTLGCFCASLMEDVFVHVNIQLLQTSFRAEVGLHEFNMWLLMMLGLSRTLFGVSGILFRPRKRVQNRLQQQPCALDGSSQTGTMQHLPYICFTKPHSTKYQLVLEVFYVKGLFLD